MTARSEPDRPPVGAIVDVVADTRGEPALSWVVEADDGELLLTVPWAEALEPQPLEIGDRLTVLWKSGSALRRLPAELVAVEMRGEPHWRLRPVGPAMRGELREAVRGPLMRSVRIGRPVELVGVTADIGAGGLRCILGPTAAVDAARLGPGDVVDVWLSVSPPLTCRAEVRRYARDDDGTAELALRFFGLPPDVEGEIHRQVEACLRKLHEQVPPLS